MGYKLQTTYTNLEKKFKNEHLAGKTIQEGVKILGKPAEIDYVPRWGYDMRTFEPTKYESPYFRLTYYTDNPVLNFIGWFPCGGTRVFADENNKLTGIKEYCY